MRQLMPMDFVLRIVSPARNPHPLQNLQRVGHPPDGENKSDYTVKGGPPEYGDFSAQDLPVLISTSVLGNPTTAGLGNPRKTIQDCTTVRLGVASECLK